MKNAFKRILSIFLALSLVFSIVTVCVSAESSSADYTDIHSFEIDDTKNYIRNLQTNSYADETKISISVSDEQAEHGSKSLKVQMLDGAAKGQYINLTLANFKPDLGKWYNLKVFVPENSSSQKFKLTYCNTSGTIKHSQTYYFEDYANNPVVTDEIREKGKWTVMSFQIPEDVSLRCVGIYTESFGDSNAGSYFYIDSYSVTDKALDTIRFLDMDDLSVRYGFESGDKEYYIRNLQKDNYENETKISISISNEQAYEGKKSMKIEMLEGAAKGQYINLLSERFNVKSGKCINFKVFVPESSNTDKISLIYNTAGTIKQSDTYYFDTNGNTSLPTHTMREKGKWTTMSLQIPAGVALRCIGIYTESFESSNAGALFYIDSYSITDSGLDVREYAVGGEKTLDSSYKAESLSSFTDASVISNNGGAVLEIVNGGQDNSSLKATVSQDTYITFSSKIDFTAGDWINLRVKSENLQKVQVFYSTNSEKRLSDELSIGDEWTVVSFKKSTISGKKAIGLLLVGNGSLFIDEIYSSSQPFDLNNSSSDLECKSSYFGLKSDYLITNQNDDWKFVASKFNSNISDTTIDFFNVATGSPATLKVSGCTIKEYEFSVLGDINGDAAVNSYDIVSLKKYLLGVNELSGAYFVAADVCISDSVNILDYISLNRMIAGEETKEVLTYSDSVADHTEALREYLQAIYGKYTLAGQQFLTSKYPEISCIYGTTGELPALMGFDMQGADRSTKISSKVKEAIKWYNECNGIVTFMWHWSVPRDMDDLSKGYSYYKYWSGKTNGTKFSIAKAVTVGTDEYVYVLRCIDNIAIQLKELQKAGVPVLWRPLHEAAGDKLAKDETSAWYWWGAGTADNYKALWNLIYDRLENYHGLENLIWVWNGQDITWMPDSSTFDIASYDNYGSDSPANRAYEKLNGAISDKMLALSESGHLPKSIDGTKWLYFVGWYTEHIYKASNGKLVPNEEWNNAETLINNYQSEYVITLDELPMLSYKNKNGVPAPIEYYKEHGCIEGGNPQWQDGEITLEAELANTTSCKYYGGEECSGFGTVLWVGKNDGSDLIFTVDVPDGEAGNYIAQVYYYVSEAKTADNEKYRYHTLTCNGKNLKYHKYPQTSKGFLSVNIDVTLNDGTNTLGFYHTSESYGYLEVDCIKLIKK